MKTNKRTVILILMVVLVFGLAACSADINSDTAESQPASGGTNVNSEVDSMENGAEPEIIVEPENTIEPEIIIESENNIELQDVQMETTPIILNMNGTDVHATLNNTVIAQEFMKLLPYSLTVSRAADDLCGSVSEQLNNDDSQNSQGWKIGEIGWFGGWFTILVDHEENFANMSVPIIGSIDDEDIAFVQSLSGRVDIAVRLVGTAGEEDDEITQSPSENQVDVIVDEPVQNLSSNQITLTVNDTVMTATLVENSSAQALKDLLAGGPLTISMQDYGGMEKVGSIGQSLPTNDEQINTEAGDLILFMGNAFVIYYAPNSWNFTRLGKINNVTATELKEILGNGNVNVTLQLVP